MRRRARASYTRRGEPEENIASTEIRAMKVEIFISYSHKDKSYLADNDLLGFIKGLERNDVAFWWDENLVTGENWDDEIKSRIKKAHIALVLVSQWLLDSVYCTDVEIKGFLQECRERGLIMFPVILSPCERSEEN